MTSFNDFKFRAGQSYSSKEYQDWLKDKNKKAQERKTAEREVQSNQARSDFRQGRMRGTHKGVPGTFDKQGNFTPDT